MSVRGRHDYVVSHCIPPVARLARVRPAQIGHCRECCVDLGQVVFQVVDGTNTIVHLLACYLVVSLGGRVTLQWTRQPHLHLVQLRHFQPSITDVRIPYRLLAVSMLILEETPRERTVATPKSRIPMRFTHTHPPEEAFERFVHTLQHALLELCRHFPIVGILTTCRREFLTLLTESKCASFSLINGFSPVQCGILELPKAFQDILKPKHLRLCRFEFIAKCAYHGTASPSDSPLFYSSVARETVARMQRVEKSLADTVTLIIHLLQ